MWMTPRRWRSSLSARWRHHHLRQYRTGSHPCAGTLARQPGVLLRGRPLHVLGGCAVSRQHRPCRPYRRQLRRTDRAYLHRPKDLNHVSEYEKTCNLFLFDTKCEQYGGSGNQFDWNILHTYNGQVPFLLSGGINSHSANALKAFDHPRLAGYDLNTRRL